MPRGEYQPEPPVLTRQSFSRPIDDSEPSVQSSKVGAACASKCIPHTDTDETLVYTWPSKY